MTHDRVPVLTYHSLDTTGSVISVDPAAFRAQMQVLASRGFTGVRADALVAAWNGGRALPARPVVLTFDDGFANFDAVAAPVLREHGFSATVYVIAGLAGMTNEWPGQPSHIPRLPLMTWDAIGRLASAGFEIGGHTMSHPDLRTLSGDALEDQIAASKEMIAGRSGAQVATFAYPYGAISEEARRVASANYAASFSTILGDARASEDRHRVRRIDMYYYRDPRAFGLFGSWRGSVYIGIRGLGRIVRGHMSDGLRSDHAS